MSSKLIGLDGCAVKTVDRARVTETQRLLINRDEAGSLAQLFRLLGDPGRARILYALLEAGELCVCDLAATVEMAETAVSHALRLLRTAEVVQARRAGRMIYYRLHDEHVRLLLDLSREHLRHGEAGAKVGRGRKKRTNSGRGARR